MSGYFDSDYDPYLLAELVGQEYNPSQGYPLKQVSDQIWDVYGPTPDYLIAQLASMANPNREDFSLDALFAADPLLRGPVAQALSHAEGDTAAALNYVGGDKFQNQLRQQIGRTEWDQLREQGDLRSIAAIGGEELDQAGIDYYNRGIEAILAGGAPTSQRNVQMYDQIAQRFGGRPYPGVGTDVAQFGGPGFSQGNSDPLAALAQSPQYSAATEAWRGGAQQSALDMPDRYSYTQPDGDVVSAPTRGDPNSGRARAAFNRDQGEQRRSAPIDLDATPEGTAFGEGIMDIGPMDVPDRLDVTPEGRFAVINGRRYALPDTMNLGGTNPYYNQQLRAVTDNRRMRLQESAREKRQQQRNSNNNGGGWRTAVGDRLNAEGVRGVLRNPLAGPIANRLFG